MKEMNGGLLETAERAARAGGGLILDNLGKLSDSDIDIKNASDFVTYVDRESEKLIIDTIRDKFPGHHFLVFLFARPQPGEADGDVFFRDETRELDHAVREVATERDPAVPRAIGVALDLQLVEAVPMDDRDVRLEAVVTPSAMHVVDGPAA